MNSSSSHALDHGLRADDGLGRPGGPGEPNHTMQTSAAGIPSAKQAEARAENPSSEHVSHVDCQADSGADGKAEHLGLRLLRVLVVAACYFVLEIVIKVVTVAQFIIVAWRKDPSQQLQRLGAMIAEYMQQFWRYCTFASDSAPWPFKPWPHEAPEQDHSM